MPLESASYIHELDASNPAATDLLQNADEHIRMIKAAIKATFPNINAAVSATDEALNDLFTMPQGAIMLWYGTTDTVPTGWAICNGQTVNGVTTPDLRDRFVVGAGSTFGWGATGGATTDTAATSTDGAHTHTAAADAGGAHSHGGATGSTALTVDQMPSHSHTVTGNPGGSAGANCETGTGGATSAISTSSTGGGQGHTHTIASDGSHTHTVTVDSGGSHSHSVTVDTVPPYKALHYIMKV